MDPTLWSGACLASLPLIGMDVLSWPPDWRLPWLPGTLRAPVACGSTLRRGYERARAASVCWILVLTRVEWA